MTNPPAYPGPPRWVKILGVIALMGLGAFVVLHIATGGLAHIVDHGLMGTQGPPGAP